MHQIPKSKISRSALRLVTLLSTQIWNVFGFAPQGCKYSNGEAICSFGLWSPPLLDKDFGPEPVHQLRLNHINGIIPAGAFSGLNGPLTDIKTTMYLNCYKGETILSRDIFTPNLHWLEDLRIYQCYLQDGLPSRLLENLKNLKKLSLWKGGIDGMVVHDALAGLTNLQFIVLQAPLSNGTFPAGLFDGLKNLTWIDLRDEQLDLIPPKWFDNLFSLKTIILNNNNLRSLPAGLFDDLRSLNQVLLENNPWHCSCELTWLLDWSHYTAGGICQSPSLLKNIDLEDALGLLECTSTPGFSANTITEIRETSIPTFTGLKVTKTSTPLQREWTLPGYTPTEKFSVPVSFATVPMKLTTPFTSTATTISFQSLKPATHGTASMMLTMLPSSKAALSTTMALETTSTPILTNTAKPSETRILKVSHMLPSTCSTSTKSGICLPSFSFADSKLTQIYLSATLRRFISHQKAANVDGSAKSYYSIVVVSTFSALILLFVVCRIICVGRLNRVDNSDNSIPDTESSSIDRSNSALPDT